MASVVVVSGEVSGAALGWMDPVVVGVVAVVTFPEVGLVKKHEYFNKTFN